MRLTGDIDIRIEFCNGRSFIDIQSLENQYQLGINFYDFNCYWILGRTKDRINRLLLFPDKSWFDEWLSQHKNEIKIILSAGIVSVEKK